MSATAIDMPGLRDALGAPGAPATAADPGEAPRCEVTAAAAARLAARFPAWVVTVEQCWHDGLAFHAVARGGAARPGLYAAVTGSEAELAAVLGRQPVPAACDRAAGYVRRQVAAGVLPPGALAPAPRDLSAVTGIGATTCRRALALLAAEGILVRAGDPRGRLRVPGGGITADPRAIALASRRAAARLTQRELAACVGCSVSTVIRAETRGPVPGAWFWQEADAALGAGGELAALYFGHLHRLHSRQRGDL